MPIFRQKYNIYKLKVWQLQLTNRQNDKHRKFVYDLVLV